MKQPGTLYVCEHVSWRADLKKILDRAGLAKKLNNKTQILIKPNLVEAQKPPVTTPVALVGALIDSLRAKAPQARILIGEGTGASGYDTWHPFAVLGYAKLAADKDVELIDLNEAELVKQAKPECARWPEIYLPRVLFESVLISMPVLKAHTLANVTLTMKNMMGAVPPLHYQQGGFWKKASFHKGIHEAILDLNRYRTPDFTILDATVGMSRSHLWGPTCEPRPNKLVCGFDPVAVDAYGAGLLCRDWRRIGYIRMAHGLLGKAEPLRVVSVNRGARKDDAGPKDTRI